MVVPPGADGGGGSGPPVRIWRARTPAARCSSGCWGAEEKLKEISQEREETREEGQSGEREVM